MSKEQVIHRMKLYFPIVIGSLWIVLYNTPMMISQHIVITPFIQYLISVLSLIVLCELAGKIISLFGSKRAASNEG